MLFIILLYISLYVLLEGRELLRSKSWREALVGAVIIAICIVYGVDYVIIESRALPHPGLLFEKLMPLVEAYNSFFKLGG